MSGYFGGRPANSLLFSQNPLIGRGVGRQILQIPFDDSIDGSHALECFFQMPSQVKAIRSAYVWVQAKPFRQYVSASSSSAAASAHYHSGSLLDKASPDPSTSTDSAHFHTFVGPSNVGSVLGATGQEVFPVGGHVHPIATTLTPGIFETAATGTLSLAVADNGVNYGTNIVSGIAVATGITKQTLTGLTNASGDKRVKITGTALCRLQVLIALDLRVAVLS